MDQSQEKTDLCKKSPLFPAVMALIGFQVICLGMVDSGISSLPEGRIIAQESRICPLAEWYPRVAD